MQEKYPVGSSLPSEADLCSQYGISRTATREAVKMLTAKGLISSRPRQGIKVQELKRWNLFDTDILEWVLLGKPDLYMLRHFLQLRLALEPEAAYLAAQYAENDDLVQIEAALVRMKDATDGYDYIKGRYSLRDFKLSGKKKELIIQQHKSGKFTTTYKTFKVSLHGLPFKISKVEVDNVEIPLKDLKLNGDNTLTLTKEFTELHIIG